MASTHSNISQNVELNLQGRSLKEPALVGFVLFFVAAVYIATLRFDFVYDDHGIIVNNILVRSWRYVPEYFLGRTWHAGFENAAVNYYRPLNFVWMRLNYALFGPHPLGWHATAILLHLLVTLLAYFVARRGTGRPFAGALSALIFGIHPMTHEVVAWVCGTTESLWSAFAFGAFLCYLKFRDTQRAMWLVGLCGLCAV